MKVMRSFIIAGICVSVVFILVYSAEKKSSASVSKVKPAVVVPIGKADWAVYMEAPDYHFALAKEYLQKGDYAQASYELKRGNSYLEFQQTRLATVSKEIEGLSRSLVTNQTKDTTRLDSLTHDALKVLSNKYAMVPVDVSATVVFEEEYEYRFTKAKTKLLENDPAAAALEIRRAASLIKLKAAHLGHIAKAELDAGENVLTELASRVEAGTAKDIKEMDRVFKKATLVFQKKIMLN